MTEIYITLKDKEGNDLPYQIDQIFSMEGTEQLYCAAVYYGVDTVENEVVILRCDLNANGQQTEISIFDIPDADEYARVAAAYQEQAEQAAAQNAVEEIKNAEDFLTMVDGEGKEHSFIVHMIFKDENSDREYIAMQEVDEQGIITEEIALYRFREEKETATVEMIASDMEYERARQVFIGLIEDDAGLLPS